MRDKRLTIVDLPKTRKQIELNHQLSYRIDKKWKNLLNNFFKPETPLTMREGEIVAFGIAAVIITFLYMLMWVGL